MTAIPTAAAELEEWLSDPSKMSGMFNEDGTAKAEFGEFVKNYAQSQVRRDETIRQQVEEQVQASLADIAKANGGSGRPAVGGSSLSTPKSAAPGRKADGLFASRADFLYAAAMHGMGGLGDNPDLRDKLGELEKIQNSYGTKIPADGGFLVPEEVRQDIMQVALETAITRPRATVIPMSTQSLSIPAVDETTHAGKSLFGGVVCYRAAEKANLTDTSGKFARVGLEATKLTAYSEVPSELPEDAPAFEAWFMANMPKAYAWTEDYDFINGGGVDEPLGWLHAQAAIAVSKEASQAADTVQWENVVKMYARMLPTSMGSAAWVANTDVLPQLALMSLNVGTGGSAIWLNDGTAGPPARILGRPVYFTEKVPTLGDSGDLNFVDLSYYAIGDRQAMRWGVSRDYLFKSDELAYRLIGRNDGRPTLLSALTPAHGTSTLSAFVKLEARA